MKVLKYTLLILLGLLTVLLVWGVVIEPYRIDQREETVTIPGLPPAWEGKRVALVADFQVGMWLANTATVREIVQHLVEQQPALVLIAGDFIYHPTDEESIEEAREELESEELQETFGELNQALELLQSLLKSDIPVYAVLGNHDYGMGTPEDVKLDWLADQVHKALEAAGIQVLENVATPLPSPDASEGENLYLVGIGSHYANNARPQQALAQLSDDVPRLVLMHN
ncbi:MAG: metallophosphoesterase, partial [Candidatus Competibacteraceae bacterium]|nr:metallophosphoesterase [Candidatus Competibacteraceae bacterium]